jgi:hypothetical protein
MPWNYRLVRRVFDTEEQVGVHEVYYTDGKPTSITVNPIGIVGETEKEVKDILEKIKKAFLKPVLNWEDFCGKR